MLKSFLYPLSIRFIFFHLCVTAQKHLRQTSYIILLKDVICWSMGPQDGWWVKRKLLVLVCPGSYLITLGPLNSWLARNVSRTLMFSNGLVNTAGVNLIYRPIIRFTFSGRRITLFTPARLVDSWSSQAVEFSAAIILRIDYREMGNLEKIIYKSVSHWIHALCWWSILQTI